MFEDILADKRRVKVCFISLSLRGRSFKQEENGGIILMMMMMTMM